MEKEEITQLNKLQKAEDIDEKNENSDLNLSKPSLFLNNEIDQLIIPENSEKTPASEAIISSPSTENSPDDDEWLDIMGSGNFKKLVIKKGNGHETRPEKGDRVTVRLSCFVNDKLVEEQENLQVIVGDMDVIQGLDLVFCLMEKDEVAKVKIPPKLAYGKLGRSPEIPPESELEYEVHLKDVQPVDHNSLSVSERLNLGDEKRARGNFFYERSEYLEAIFCYGRSAEYLEGVRDSSGSTPEESQKVVDMIVKVYNNMAASHLKLGAYQAALKAVESVLNIQPKNVKALFRKAKILGAQGSTDEAINCLKVAISMEPDTKVLQSELIKLKNQKRKEEESQRAMYKRMFPQSEPKKVNSFSKALKLSAITAGMTAIVAGMVAFKYLQS
ncbi:peptidyl-prolyl cis-trans isomerase FKBP8 [Parasteatoda tepidariorum]|nr:peptidyl-prolyl cis-trans isomerase FKBP8 [Parasteatoda tepidariorum]